MDAAIKLLLEITDAGVPTAKRAKLIDFAKVAEKALTISLRMQLRLHREPSHDVEYLAGASIPFALAECREQSVNVRRLLALRASRNGTTTASPDDSPATIGRLRFVALAAAVAQLLATGVGSAKEPLATNDVPTPGRETRVEGLEARSQLDEFLTAYQGLEPELLTMLRRNQEAADITREGFVQLHEHLRTTPVPVRNMRGWIVTAIKNLAKKFGQRASRSPVCLEDANLVEDHRNNDGMDEITARQDKEQEAIRLMMELPYDDRELLIATILDELKPQECVQKLFYVDQRLRDRAWQYKRRGELLKKLHTQLQEYERAHRRCDE